MADDADNAAARIEAERASGVAVVQLRLVRAGRNDCEDCADPIEPERLQALPSATKCVFCQEASERRGLLYRRA